MKNISIFLGYHFNTCSVDNTIPAHSTTIFVARKAWPTNTLKGVSIITSWYIARGGWTHFSCLYESLFYEVNSCLDIIRWFLSSDTCEISQTKLCAKYQLGNFTQILSAFTKQSIWSCSLLEEWSDYQIYPT